jgi:biopolymer transport protein ExbD
MRAKPYKSDNIQFQIAPMVDIIFILILFFMVSAGSVKVENELSIRLPGTVQQSHSVQMIDEQIVEVREDGQIVLNDQPYDSPTDRDLPQLLVTLKRFKEMADATQTPALITVLSAPNAKYERVIDVLNVCTAAKVSDVTFAVSGGDT